MKNIQNVVSTDAQFKIQKYLAENENNLITENSNNMNDKKVNDFPIIKDFKELNNDLIRLKRQDKEVLTTMNCYQLLALTFSINFRKTYQVS